MKKNNTHKLFTCIGLIFISALVQAQNIGISSNGATPAASAMLDISSTDKGLLIPRVALTATNAAGPVTSPATSLLVYNTATAGTSPSNVVPGHYYWNGSVWKILGYASPNEIIVETLADLPTPVSGGITLDATKQYRFIGTVNISSNYINLNGAPARGTGLADGVLSSVSGAVLRSSGKNVFLSNFLVVLAGGSSKAYDFSDGSGLLNCILFSGNQVFDATPSVGVGQISGFNNVLIQSNAWSTADGLKLTGSVNRFGFFASLADNMTSGVGIEFLAGLTINDISISNSFFENSSMAMKADAGYTFDIGRVNGNILRNVTTPLTGFDSNSPGWEMLGNSNIPNSRTYGYTYMNSNATATALPTLNTFVKIAGTTTSTILHKVSSPANNRLTYTGKRAITVSVFVAISGTSPSTSGALSVALAKNGTVITAPFASLSAMSNNQSFQLVLDTEVDLVTNDYVEVFIANNLNTASYTISALQFRIVD